MRYSLQLISLFLFSIQSASQAQSLSTENVDSLAAQYNIAVSKLTSPAREERKRIRRIMQQTGYSNVLMDVLDADAFWAITSFVKAKLHIEYSISHRPLTVTFPIRVGEGGIYSFVLQDDWRFPADPWKKE